MTVKQLNKMVRPVASPCCNQLVPEASCRPGVTRIMMEEAGLSSSGDRMGRSTSLSRGSTTRCGDVALDDP